PYQHVVADVNMDDNINVLDVVHIRMVIMGQTPTYPAGPTWRFVDRDYEFSSDADDWLTEVFPEVYNANDLAGDILNADFYALEMGNVSEGSIASSAELGSSADRDARSNAELMASVLGISSAELCSSAEMRLQAGNTYEVGFTAEQLYGLQGTLELQAGLELVDISYGLATAQNVNLERAAEGVITFSWDDAEAAMSSAEWSRPSETSSADLSSALFTLSVRATVDGDLSDLLSLTDRITGAEAYPLSGGVSNLVLTYSADEQSSADEFSLGQNAPNPVDGFTQISFTLPEAETAILTVRDVQGRTVLVREIDAEAGVNLVTLQREDLSVSGVYSYTLVTGEFVATKQMVIR
ncbi:MAG: T9SS type A sorting domain-containing protein, partial [Bacteroidota bacterium]